MRTAHLAATFLIVSAGTSVAADGIERGRDLAERWCAGCHVIGPGTSGGDAGPTFESIASRDWQTEWSVKRAIALPHPTMPDLRLSAPEYVDLSSYIMSLAK